jgi:hypothetical protein
MPDDKATTYTISSDMGVELTYNINDYLVDTVTIPNTTTITIDDEVFTTTPDYESKKMKSEIGVDMIQNVKRKFENE